MDRVRETAAWSAEELPPAQPPKPAWRAGMIRSRYAIFVAGVLLALAAAGTVVVLTSHDTRTGGGGAVAAGTSSPGTSAGPLGSTTGPSASASPSASAKASGTPKASGGTSGSLPPQVQIVGGCAPNPSACGFPDDTNTGVPAGVKLTAKSGDMSIKTSGTVISGIDLQGCISIYATNVTIKDSKIHCPGPYGIFSYEGYYSGGGALIEDTEVDCMQTQATGIASYGFKALRVNVHGCENGFAVDFNVTIQDSYVHGMFTNDPNTPQAGHSDGIQMGGNNNLITHNTIFNLSDGGTSAIITDPTALSNTTITDNLLAGGGYSLYCPKTTSSNVQVTDNRFGKIFSPKGGSFAAWVYCNQVAVVKANVWDDTLGAVPF